METEKCIPVEKIRDVSVMTVPHHGSRFSSGADFLKQTNPKIAIISAGKNNSYGHPHKETLERLDEFTQNGATD